MKKAMNLSLRANEKIYINGAILKFDRKVTFEILNDATFLLETHVIQSDQTTTPLRQLYFVVQTMLVDPRNAETARLLFEQMLMQMACNFEDPIVLRGLQHIDMLVADDRFFDALKQLRGLFPAEADILASSGQARETNVVELPLDEAIPAMPFASAPLVSHVA
ncbi:flagellar biosynthesis repressor FlbT [Bosea sp. PAMC 26642]|uniref:flagellar biosynthesis repressor FlbT n=1 Tax=Bosea sp. (strain PAMC 26642) TaxID=1792307 RepID=UPI0009EC4EF9|nr:flagellar biosynthesis repressor FlbT [Bosea sp. PAMC 26642]